MQTFSPSFGKKTLALQNRLIFSRILPVDEEDSRQILPLPAWQALQNDLSERSLEEAERIFADIANIQLFWQTSPLIITTKYMYKQKGLDLAHPKISYHVIE